MARMRCHGHLASARSRGQVLLLAMAIGSTVAAAPGCEQPPPMIQPGAEVSFDGLHRVSRSRMQQAWARPDLSLAAYDAILLAPTEIRYRTPRGEAARTRGSFPLSETQKQRLAELVHDEFRRELGRSDQFALTDGPGEKVLVLQATLLDVVSFVSPEPSGRDMEWVASFGEATLVIELRDSESGEIIARALDRQAATPPTGELMRNTRVHVTNEVRRIARRWARALRTSLDQLRSIALEDADGAPGQRPSRDDV